VRIRTSPISVAYSGLRARARTCALALAGAAVLAAGPASRLGAQEGGLEEQFRTLALQNAELYLSPVTEGLGHALAAGFAETARTHRVLGFNLGVRLMAALPAEQGKTFEAVLPGAVDFKGQSYSNPYAPRDGTLSTPSATGSGAGVVLTPQGAYRNAILAAGENPANYDIEFPEGLELPVVPFAIAEAAIGLPYQTEVVLRLVPAVTPDEEIGQIRARGFGAKHTVSQWLPRAPLDVAVFFGVQHFEVGEYLDATARTVGVIGSRSLGPLTAFGHLRRSSASVDVGYTVDNPDDNPGLPADGSRLGFTTEVPGGLRVGGGVTLRLLGLGITGEYTTGEQRIASVKAGLSIR
jgi:hypothetical protein